MIIIVMPKNKNILKIISQILTFFILLSLVTPSKISHQTSLHPLGNSLPIKSFHLIIDKPQTLKLPHSTSILIQLNQTNTDPIIIDYTSSGLFQTCISISNATCINNHTIYKQFHGNLNIEELNQDKFILIINPSKSKALRFRFRMHFNDSDCHTLNTRTVYHQLFGQSNCFQFVLEGNQDAELMIERSIFVELDYSFILCGSSVEGKRSDLDEHRYLFSQNQIESKCKEVKQKILSVKIASKQSNTSQVATLQSGSQQSTTTLLLILQYPKQTILLADGLAYSTSIAQNCKYFQYQLINKLNTTIKVQSTKAVQIFVKVVDQQNKNNIKPNSLAFDYSSKTGIIFSYFRPFLTITQTDLEQKLCTNCFLSLAICLQQQTQNKTDPITVQVTQDTTILSPGVMKHNFLAKHSTAFYTYTSHIHTTIFIQLSDNNKHCARIFLSDQEIPGSQNNLAKEEQSNQLTYLVNANQVYYIAVEAKQDCPYSIVVYDSMNSVTNLQMGRFGFLSLQAGQFKYFLIKSTPTKYFKLLSLHIYGNVQIYINRTTLTSIHKSNKQQLKNILNYAMKGQYANRLMLLNTSELFCPNCYYLVAINAIKHTQSILYYGDQYTAIPIRDKTINDMMIKAGDKVNAQYYGKQESNIEVKVFSGKLAVDISKDKKNYHRVYDKNQKTVIDHFNINSDDHGFIAVLVNLFDWRPIHVVFTALEDNTIYSIKMTDHNDQINNTDQQTSTPKQIINYMNVQAGESQSMMVSSTDSTCLNGYIKDQSQKILLSSAYSYRHSLSLLQISATLSGKPVELLKQQIQNIMTLSLPALEHYYLSQGVKYQICIKSKTNQTLWLTIMQSQDFSLLPSQTDTIVKHQNYTFVVHAQSDIIVQLFQCKGNANILYSSSRQKLDNTSTKGLDMIGLPNQPHAIRINRYSTTFFKIEAQLAIVRWFNMNIEKGIGTGYLDYQVGFLRYGFNFLGMDISWQSLSRQLQRQSSSIINSINYTLYISSNEQDLKSASQCQSFLEEDTLQIQNIVDSSISHKLNTTFTFTLKGQSIRYFFGTQKTIYATIVADVLLMTNSSIQKNGERYRFIYPHVQISAQLLAPQPFESLTYSQILSIIIFIILTLLIFTYVCSRKIMPMLGILKNRMLVQESHLQKQERAIPKSQAQGMLQVPPSSDRNTLPKHNQLIQKDEYIQAQ